MEIEQESDRIQAGENRILDELARLHERMATLEKQLSLKINLERLVPDFHGSTSET